MLSTLARGLKLSRREALAFRTEGKAGLLSMAECDVDRAASMG